VIRGQHRQKYSKEDSEQMSDHQSAPGIGKRLGEFLILAIYLAVDVNETWHHSHFWTLAIALIGIVALLLLDGGFSWRQIAASATVVLAACVVIYIVAPEQVAPDVEIIGTLQPGSLADPPNNCPGATSPEAWRIMIGNNAMQFNDPVEVSLLQIGSCKVVTVKRDESGLSVAADLFDEKGKLIATIKNNEFHALSGAGARVDRDHDLSKLIVFNGEGQEILFVHYLNKTTVRVRGVFGCPGHSLVPVRDNQPIPGVMMPGVCINIAKGARLGSVFGIR
jgi:hypothetical protein